MHTGGSKRAVTSVPSVGHEHWMQALDASTGLLQRACAVVLLVVVVGNRNQNAHSLFGIQAVHSSCIQFPINATFTSVVDVVVKINDKSAR